MKQPTNEALITGLIDEWFDHYDVTVERLLEPEDTSGRWTRAHIRATFEPPDLISRALDGVTLAYVLWRDQESPQERAQTRDLLLKLTEQSGPLV